jgi:exopolyphosphatase / guanosine-5'-triphosphate,3'-diphosphate pyrophosphatase
MRVAVIDIGTNSTRLLIADVANQRVTAELDRRTNVTRLGAGVDHNGRLNHEAIARVLDTVAAYRTRIDELHADRAIGVLTSAVRDAANGAEFTRKLASRYDLEPYILTGDEEAQLTFLGVTSDRNPADTRTTLVIDIGGGSTELVIGTGRTLECRVSTQAGVVRQSERHIHTDPPTDAELEAVRDDVQATIAGAVPSDRRQVDHAIAVAGTPTSLAAIAQHLDPYDSEKVHGYHLDAAERDRILAHLRALPLRDRERVAGLQPARAPAIIPGVVILTVVMDMFGLPEVEVSEHDILRGAALGL